MDTGKIIKQAMKNLGININDMDINKNPYYQSMAEELEDMREQILDKFSFQIKIAYNLAKLHTESYPSIFVNGYECSAYALPTDYLNIRSTNTLNHESVRVKGNVVYLPNGQNYMEYFSRAISYEDFPVYSEKYVLACLVARSAVYFGKPANEFEQKAEYEKQILKNNENANNGFEYSNNDLVRR